MFFTFYFVIPSSLAQDLSDPVFLLVPDFHFLEDDWVLVSEVQALDDSVVFVVDEQVDAVAVQAVDAVVLEEQAQDDSAVLVVGEQVGVVVVALVLEEQALDDSVVQAVV